MEIPENDCACRFGSHFRVEIRYLNAASGCEFLKYFATPILRLTRNYLMRQFLGNVLKMSTPQLETPNSYLFKG